MDLVKAMTVFVRVVEMGSLTAAADACELSPTMAGNYLKALETRLGARLIHRTTRRLQTSSFGRIYYGRCVEILALVEDAERLAFDHLGTPRGLLRITAPMIFSNECLIPSLADFCERYPEVQLDVVAADTVSNLLEDRFDAAIRIGNPRDADLVARPLQPYRLVICASSAYLDAHGVPQTPDALRAHQCLTYSYPLHSELRATQPEWTLTGADGNVSVPVGGRLRIDSAEALRRAVLAGMGLALLPAILVDADIRAGRLNHVLPGYASPVRPLNLLYLGDRQMSLKLRCFVEFILARFGLADSEA
jgi:DNA-binding transcriptional LysR family regulator